MPHTTTDFREDLQARIRMATANAHHAADEHATEADQVAIREMLQWGDPVSVHQLSTNASYLDLPTPLVTALASLATLVDIAENYLPSPELMSLLKSTEGNEKEPA